MDEFELIRRYFDRPVTSPGATQGVVKGIGDDGAVLMPTAGFELVQVIDSLVEGVHFLADADPSDIGYRVVAVNLSDIAAMGARPRWMTLALTLSGQDPHWVEQFAAGLHTAADEFDVVLVGGDTTSGAAVVATVAITGEVEQGKALLRSGAQVGDAIFVSGSVGDAAAGLQLLSRKAQDNFLTARFCRPTARIHLGRELSGRASAVIDISDGLVGDLKKLLVASEVGAEIDVDRLPLSDALRQRFSADEQRSFALIGGDDYELCFTADPDRVKDIAGVTAIGVVTGGQDLVCMQDGNIVDYDDSGYRHFQ